MDVVLTIVFTAVTMYLLYFVIRAAVRDGIRLARLDENPEPSSASPADDGAAELAKLRRRQTP